MKQPSKPLSTEDIRLWAEYGQSLTRLLPGRAIAPLPIAQPLTVAAAPAPKTPPKTQPVTTAANPAGLDKSTWKKFSSGQMRTAQKLDLHGHTAARAHHAVTHFIEHAHATQSRCVEIITGNGEVLARELPHWLNTPRLRPLILAITHPHAANTGAVRILLRRLRASF